MHKVQEVQPRVRGHAARVFIEGPGGKTVLVYNPKKPKPQRKLPGGEKELGETPVMTALREVREETGLVGRKSHLTLIAVMDRGDHDFYLYKLWVNNFDGFRPKRRVEKGIYEAIKNGKRMDDREEAEIFNISQLSTLEDFSTGHREFLRRFGIIDG